MAKTALKITGYVAGLAAAAFGGAKYGEHNAQQKIADEVSKAEQRIKGEYESRSTAFKTDFDQKYAALEQKLNDAIALIPAQPASDASKVAGESIGSVTAQTVMAGSDYVAVKPAKSTPAAKPAVETAQADAVEALQNLYRQRLELSTSIRSAQSKVSFQDEGWRDAAKRLPMFKAAYSDIDARIAAAKSGRPYSAVLASAEGPATAVLAGGEDAATSTSGMPFTDQVKLHYEETVGKHPQRLEHNLNNALDNLLGDGADQEVVDVNGNVIEGVVKKDGDTSLLEGVGRATIGTLCELFTLGKSNPFNENSEGSGIPIGGAVFNVVKGSYEIVAGANHTAQDLVAGVTAPLPPLRYVAVTALDCAPGGDASTRVLTNGAPVWGNLTRDGVQATPYTADQLEQDETRFERAINRNVTNTHFRRGFETLGSTAAHYFVVDFAESELSSGGDDEGAALGFSFDEEGGAGMQP